MALDYDERDKELKKRCSRLTGLYMALDGGDWHEYGERLEKVRAEHYNSLANAYEKASDAYWERDGFIIVCLVVVVLVAAEVGLGVHWSHRWVMGAVGVALGGLVLHGVIGLCALKDREESVERTYGLTFESLDNLESEVLEKRRSEDEQR